ncbi:MAG: ice-binding family protein [bacterium]
MKIMFNKNSIVIALAVSLIIGFGGPTFVSAATAPTLGSSASYGIVSTTYTNTAGGTTINGDICYTTGPAVTPTIVGATVVPCAAARGTDQSNALSVLNGQVCTSVSGALNAVVIPGHAAGTFPPGCYVMAGAIDLTLNTDVTLDGPGVYVFRSGAALTTGANSNILLINGATADNVFWAPVGATTLGANSSFVGNILDDAGITLGSSATLLGRALAFGELVKTNSTNTITVPATLRVVKVVVNGGGGTAVSSDFSLSVKKAGVNVSGSPALGTVSPGTSYSLSAGIYVVSEVANPAYTQSFSGDCDSGGSVTLTGGDNKICTITNTEIVASPATLRVAKVVVNGSTGTSIPSDFTMHIKKAGVDVVSPAPGVTTPGNSYSLSAGTYVISEDVNSSYTQVFSGDCNSSGSVILATGEDKTCTIINTDIPTGVGTGGGSGFALLPLINITKIPTPLALPGGPGSVEYVYTVKNIGGGRYAWYLG